jgi:hypothetical protein
MGRRIVGNWVPGIPEYYFNRDEFPKIKEYYEITEQLTDRELFDFKAAFSEYWTNGKYPDEFDILSGKVKGAFRNYCFAVSQACCRKLQELSRKGVLEDAEQDH